MFPLFLLGLTAAALAQGSPAVGPAQLRAAGGAAWCGHPYFGDAPGWEDLFDASSALVALGKQKEATALLRHSSIVKLTKERAQSLAGARVPDGRNYFLVRAGVYAQADASGAQIMKQARLANRLFTWNKEKRTLLIYVLQLWNGPRTGYNLGLVVSLSVVPVHSELQCRTLD